MAAAIPVHVLKEFNEEKRTFDVFGTEAQVLVETAHLLVIEVDVEEFACFISLCDTVEKV